MNSMLSHGLETGYLFKGNFQEQYVILRLLHLHNAKSFTRCNESACFVHRRFLYIRLIYLFIQKKFKLLKRIIWNNNVRD